MVKYHSIGYLTMVETLNYCQDSQFNNFEEYLRYLEANKIGFVILGSQHLGIYTTFVVIKDV